MTRPSASVRSLAENAELLEAVRAHGTWALAEHPRLPEVAFWSEAARRMAAIRTQWVARGFAETEVDDALRTAARRVRRELTHG